MTAQEIITILQDASRAIYMTESWAIKQDKLFQLVKTRERVNDAIVALQKQEQPVCEGLEEEIERYQEEHFEYNSEFDSIRLKGDYMPSPQTLANIARHFAQWGAEHRGSSETPKDLDEAAHSYSESDEPLYSPGHRFHWDSDSLFGKQIETTFKAGAQWQREQMLKEAVEGVVSLEFSDGTGAVRTTDGFVLNGLRCGQKVPVIIVKED